MKFPMLCDAVGLDKTGFDISAAIAGKAGTDLTIPPCDRKDVSVAVVTVSGGMK